MRNKPHGSGSDRPVKLPRQPGELAEEPQESPQQQRWIKVEGTHRRPELTCSLCGRTRSDLAQGGEPHQFAEAIFRRLRVTRADGAVQDVTTCGACFAAHRPLRNRLLH